MSLLIIGSDSVIGSSLKAACLKQRVPFHETSRRPHITGDIIHLDLSEDPSHWHLPVGLQAAVICAAATRISQCETDPFRTRRINVEAPAILAKLLQARGTAIIFLSSSLVFGGHRRAAQWDDPLRPETTYGHQKAEAERLVTKAGPHVAVLRITKVVHTSMSLFAEWANRLKDRLVIEPFFDMTFSPIPISLVTETILALTEDFVPGIFQLSGDRDISYSTAALLLAKHLGTPASLVQPRRASDCGIMTPARHTALIPNLPVSRPLACPTVEDTLTNLFKHY